MTRIEVAPVGAVALDLLAALHCACFEAGWDRTALARLLATPGTAALIATAREADGETPVGLALYRAVEDESELLALGVVPARRRRGAARRLLEDCLRRVAAAGGSRMFLEVAEDNRPARRLYQGFGFVEVGRRPGYYRRRDGPAAAALTLRLDLAARAPRPRPGPAAA